MNVTVVYTTQIKATLGMAEAVVEVSAGTSAVDLLKQLAEQHGVTFGELVFAAGGQLLPSLLLCIGDKQLTAPGQHTLSDGEVLTILSAISGG